MAKRISDALLGGFTGANAGAQTLGGLSTAGIVKAGSVSPWAWGLLGGGALLGGISSLLAEDEEPAKRVSLDLSNQLAAEQVAEMKDAKRERQAKEKTRKQFSTTLGTMFSGAKMAAPRLASGGLL